MNAIITGFGVLLALSVGGCTLMALFEGAERRGMNLWPILASLVFVIVVAWVIGTVINRLRR
jgi:hypothetical protein